MHPKTDKSRNFANSRNHPSMEIRIPRRVLFSLFTSCTDFPGIYLTPIFFPASFYNTFFHPLSIYSNHPPRARFFAEHRTIALSFSPSFLRRLRHRSRLALIRWLGGKDKERKIIGLSASHFSILFLRQLFLSANSPHTQHGGPSTTSRRSLELRPSHFFSSFLSLFRILRATYSFSFPTRRKSQPHYRRRLALRFIVPFPGESLNVVFFRTGGRGVYFTSWVIMPNCDDYRARFSFFCWARLLGVMREFRDIFPVAFSLLGMTMGGGGRGWPKAIRYCGFWRRFGELMFASVERLGEVSNLVVLRRKIF